MKAQDWMNNKNNRAHIIEMLIAMCADNDLSYKYTEKVFKIELPAVEPIPITRPTRKRLPDLNWNLSEKGPDEGQEPDHKLEEGETPNES
jgi:hypothetical protein